MAIDLNKALKKLVRQEDILRLLSIYVSCYNLSKADYKNIKGYLKSDEDKDILD